MDTTTHYTKKAFFFEDVRAERELVKRIQEGGRILLELIVFIDFVEVLSTRLLRLQMGSPLHSNPLYLFVEYTNKFPTPFQNLTIQEENRPTLDALAAAGGAEKLDLAATTPSVDPTAG